MASGRRRGFTLVEVLIAAGIMVIGLTGILSLAMNAVKRSDAPEKVQDAIKYGQERLDYFRGQSNPYRAAGGTWYLPPELPDTNNFNDSTTGINCNVVFNTAPALFVREYLYGFNEHRYGNDVAGVDPGRKAADARRTAVMTLAARVFAANEIPPTPNTVTVAGAVKIVKGIVPNPDKALEPTPGNASYIYNGFATVNGPSTFYFSYMPRANDKFRATAAGMPLPKEVQFVREVWVQTSLPPFAKAGLTGFFPSDGTIASTNLSNPGNLNGYGGLGFSPPATQTNLPPYVVAVTVRVFARDAQQSNIIATDPGAGNERVTATTGPGYFRDKPLVTMVGYYGLRRFD
ncbi:MAG: hypothetical protein JWM80_5294 [Cyanobacteria bacterium RYN_339]|nr:hypothetical protein [Cyanobacteria bacterium RYN_339]